MTIEVTQDDRDRAADAVKAYRDNKNGNWQKRIRDGECDDGEMVQAFARCRHAAYEKGYRAAHMEMLIKDSGDLI